MTQNVNPNLYRLNRKQTWPIKYHAFKSCVSKNTYCNIKTLNSMKHISDITLQKMNKINIVVFNDQRRCYIDFFNKQNITNYKSKSKVKFNNMKITIKANNDKKQVLLKTIVKNNSAVSLHFNTLRDFGTVDYVKLGTTVFKNVAYKKLTKLKLKTIKNIDQIANFNYYYRAMLYQFISAQAITDYIVKQVTLQSKSRDLNFNNGLKRGFFRVAKAILAINKTKSVNGIRIQCKGK